MVLIAFQGEPYTRKLTSFVQIEAGFIIEGDASLEGLSVGIRKYNKQNPDDPGGLVAYTSFHPLPFTLPTDSSKQNTFEYITVIMAASVTKAPMTEGVRVPCDRRQHKYTIMV